ncbi:VacJ family lipoprotein [Mangrovimicrobium sediminis]|uniref:VacJ family lipoprotein n=1 Tax=Mangrovimicrobium sediminis TaxID=2562682 RepID=A0A4Z0M9E5_9GAMM|nr:VacJ family lipoprotein [Haliea sp. SAOS-164]TGD76020.1 VacJ family lipoprotein [Haliea sp. SAOS-164]
MTLPRLCLLLLLVLPLPAAFASEEQKDIDPFEPFNRKMFVLNDGLDKYLLRPVAKGYDWVMPDIAQRGVGNMFANMYDFNAAINSVLQGRFGRAAQSTGRFLVNSTLGLAGLVDIATPMGISPYRTDFGHTLAIWGFDSGPFLMVPVFGPRTVRSGTGTIFDTYTSIPTYANDNTVRNSLFGLELVDGRSRLLTTDELITGDRYIFLRDAYLQSREIFVNDGKVEDSFSDFGIENDDWEDF